MPHFNVDEDDLTKEAHGTFLNFEVYCARCGEGICHLAEPGRTRRRGMPHINVTPCESCMDNARFDARKDGYDQGYSEAKAEEHA